MTVLDEIIAATRHEVERRKREAPLAAEDARRGEQSLLQALRAPGVSVIAEFKRHSPSAGQIRAGATVAEIATAYERGGAAAMSVLTEGPHFDGSLADLAAARDACGLPLLRKDFIVDPYQLEEAVLAGADAVLLIVAALSPDALADLHAQARGRGLDVLVEVHDRAELETALAVEPQIVGINNRDLRDFTVDVRRTFELLDDMPEGVVVVSESGVGHSAQLAELARAGVDAVLIGESLMRAPDPGEALRELSAES